MSLWYHNLALTIRRHIRPPGSPMPLAPPRSRLDSHLLAMLVRAPPSLPRVKRVSLALELLAQTRSTADAFPGRPASGSERAHPHECRRASLLFRSSASSTFYSCSLRRAVCALRCPCRELLHRGPASVALPRLPRQRCPTPRAPGGIAELPQVLHGDLHAPRGGLPGDPPCSFASWSVIRSPARSDRPPAGRLPMCATALLPHSLPR